MFNLWNIIYNYLSIFSVEDEVLALRKQTNLVNIDKVGNIHNTNTVVLMHL